MIPVAICVPVRDEEAVLPDLLGALACLDAAGVVPIACLFLDGCTDRSETIARAAARDFPYPLTVATGLRGDPNAGRARRTATALGLAHASQAEGGVLLTTDADSQPRRDWLGAARRALAVADVAAGRLIRTDAGSDAIQTRVELYYDRLHACRRRIDPVPWDDAAGCHHAGGANLAFRASAYAALGGFRPLPCGEDATFLDDAARAGYRVRRDPEMVVTTSSRRIGRAPGGLAGALRAIDAAGAPWLEHPAAILRQYRTQATARRAFADIADPAVRSMFGRSIGLDGDHVLGVARDCPNAEAFAMRIVPAPTATARLVPLDEAEAALAVLEQGDPPVPLAEPALFEQVA